MKHLIILIICHQVPIILMMFHYQNICHHAHHQTHFCFVIRGLNHLNIFLGILRYQKMFMIMNRNCHLFLHHLSLILLKPFLDHGLKRNHHHHHLVRHRHCHHHHHLAGHRHHHHLVSHRHHHHLLVIQQHHNVMNYRGIFIHQNHLTRRHS